MDEVDHLGMYLRENHYVEFYKRIGGHISPSGYCGPIDRYYHELLLNGEAAPPKQMGLDGELGRLLDALENSGSRDRLRAVSELLNLDGGTRKRVELGILELRRLTRERGRPQYMSVPMRHMALSITVEAAPAAEDTGRLREESLAELLRQEADERLFVAISYGEEDTITSVDCEFLRLSDLTPEQLQQIKRLAGEQVKRRTRKHGNGKVGRNQPCPCGSGRKFKRCCGP